MITLFDQNDKIVPVVWSTFPGGEEHVRIEEHWMPHYKVFAQITSSVELVRLFLLQSAIFNAGATATLFIPYVPYARQDRICNKGEAFSLDFIVSFLRHGWSNVVYLDPHSEVLPALLRGTFYTQSAVMKRHPVLQEMLAEKEVTLVCPDAGALKKIYEVGKELHISTLVKADKKRNVLTGEIEGIEVHAERLDEDLVYLIADDICDGGKTFVELAKELKFLGAKHIHLYVTHGIFSKGFGVFEGLIEEIYTTNSWANRLPLVHNNVKVHTHNLLNSIFKEI